MLRLMRGGAFWALLMAALVAYAVVELPRAAAQGAQDYPIPSSAREVYSPIREGFAVPLEPRDALKGPRDTMDLREARLKTQREERWLSAPAFFRDTMVNANSRTYWFDEHDFGYDDPKAFTTGGSLAYQSGYLADFFQLRGVLYTTQPLYANASAGDTLNLSSAGDQITMGSSVVPCQRRTRSRHSARSMDARSLQVSSSRPGVSLCARPLSTPLTSG